MAGTAAPHLSRRWFNNRLSAGAHCRRERALAAHQREHRGCADASQNRSPLRVYLHPLLLPLVAGRMSAATSALGLLRRPSFCARDHCYRWNENLGFTVAALSVHPKSWFFRCLGGGV